MRTNAPPLDKTARIEAILALIPPGRVVSYGQVADLAGLPGRARLVGRRDIQQRANGRPTLFAGHHRGDRARAQGTGRGRRWPSGVRGELDGAPYGATRSRAHHQPQAGHRGWGTGVLEGARQVLPGHGTPAVLGSQDRECVVSAA